MNLNVKEIFYSLQGEGGRAGEASIFIRLTQCNLQCNFCDTDFENGEAMQVKEILTYIKQFPCKWIVWTGGEPTLQLTDEILLFFKKEGFLQAIESNGHYPLSNLLDYKVVSPKGITDYAKEINPEVDEIRLPIQLGNRIPPIDFFPKAKQYFISPIFSKDKESTTKNIDYCVELVKRNPRWRLSLQMHKLIGIE
jgi:organic radical activating enzyme